MEQNNKIPKTPQNKNNPKMPKFNMNWIYIIVLASLVIMYFFGGDTVKGSASKSTSYSQFQVYVQKGFASKIVANKDERAPTRLVPTPLSMWSLEASTK